MENKTKRKLIVEVPIQSNISFWIETDKTDDELREMIEESEGNFLKIADKFEVIESQNDYGMEFYDYRNEFYDDRNSTVIYTDECIPIIEFDPNLQ